MFVTETDWVPPSSLPNLSNYKEIAIDLETYDPLLMSHGPSWAFPDTGYVTGIAVATKVSELDKDKLKSPVLAIAVATFEATSATSGVTDNDTFKGVLPKVVPTSGASCVPSVSNQI